LASRQGRSTPPPPGVERATTALCIEIWAAPETFWTLEGKKIFSANSKNEPLFAGRLRPKPIHCTDDRLFSGLLTNRAVSQMYDCCSKGRYRRFGGTWYLHLQVRHVSLCVIVIIQHACVRPQGDMIPGPSRRGTEVRLCPDQCLPDTAPPGPEYKYGQYLQQPAIARLENRFV
jgi:hypothetical protein